MKFTLSWLKDHLHTDATVEQITDALTDMGLEVEETIDMGKMLSGFRAARVVEAKPHPDAQKLQICLVETFPDGAQGSAKIEQVVCGAPNARLGLIGVFAPVGSWVPGVQMRLKSAKIRGVESNGMLCSEQELMISDNHDAIIELPAGTTLGAEYSQIAGLDDVVIEIAVTPNRPDALGVAGIARDLAARSLGELKSSSCEKISGTFPCPIKVTLSDDVADKACPYFVGRLIKGLKNDPSPEWLQDRLRAIGLRPINALADITNFITYDRARPIHAFDAAKLDGDIQVRLSKTGENMQALDNREYTFDGETVLICDNSNIVAIGGIMGGIDSGCTETTSEVFFEAAYFDPLRIARSGRQLKISSDARFRFERGVDPEFTRAGLELASKMTLEICGGQASDIVVAGSSPWKARKILMRDNIVEKKTGMQISEDKQRQILELLDFSPVAHKQGLEVTPPSWRPDIREEIDLVEEIARIYSLGGLVSQPLPRPTEGAVHASLPLTSRKRDRVRRVIAARGLYECVSYSFIGAKEAKWFSKEPLLVLDNPISPEMSVMRPSPLPALIKIAARNQARGLDDFGLFEIALAFSGTESNEQKEQICGIRVGNNGPRAWRGEHRSWEVHDARADAEAVLRELAAPIGNMRIVRDTPDWLHPERGGSISLGPNLPLAYFGELHPALLQEMEIRGRAAAFMVLTDAIPASKKGMQRKTRGPLKLFDFQAVERDFSFLVPVDTEAGELIRAAKSADRELIEEVTLFDVFEGDQQLSVDKNTKSMAISVRIQPRKSTLNDKEIQEICGKIVACVSKATDGRLR